MNPAKGFIRKKTHVYELEAALPFDSVDPMPYVGLNSKRNLFRFIYVTKWLQMRLRLFIGLKYRM